MGSGNKEEINWVAELSSCRLSSVFEKLKLQIQDDIETRKAQLGEQGANYSFELIGNGSSFGNRISGRAVKFALTDTAIVVKNAKDEKVFDATLTLNDDGECRLLIDGKEKDFWQFRKKALEDLFFRSPWER